MVILNDWFISRHWTTPIQRVGGIDLEFICVPLLD